MAMPRLMKKVFVWMALALVITGITAFECSQNIAVLTWIFSSKLHFWLLIGAQFGIVIAISAMFEKLSILAGTALFIAYSIITGLTLSIIFIAFTQESITQVFFITAGTFAVMAFIGATTKTDLSKIGSLLFMALIGLIIATVVNLFMQSSMMSLIISYVGVVIFVGLTAWDTQKIKRMLLSNGLDSDRGQKIALLGALSLYLDFINMFLYLLRIMGDRK